MMDAKTIFTTASVMVLANGAILAAIHRDLPARLRGAASQWCLGTLLVAFGCIVFAFGAPLPRPVMLSAANAAFAFGLTAYYAAILSFHRLEVRVWHFLPATIATLSVVWFSTVMPDFRIRILIVSAAWIWLMALCVRVLLDRTRGHASLARSILAAMFIGVGAYSALRGALYLRVGVPDAFAVETGDNWLNVLSAMLLTLLPVMGTTAFLLMCSDRLRRGLERAAATDYLTGLPNRRSLAGRAAEAFLAAKPRDHDFSIAVFDIDKFKAINDTYGHETGDRVLIHVARRLRAEIRPTDTIARMGGEEFAVLFPDLGTDDAFAIAERMRAAVEGSDFTVGDARIDITISGGIAVLRPGDTIYDDILRRADSALYRAKSNGRNRVEIAGEAGPDSAVKARMVISPPPAISAAGSAIAHTTRQSAHP
ncbi:GGDEF domain-containing protein [Shinella sp.]|uniref:GGDEF domain-containing protein n=1 Tax=Shinella sp. TaxID=1870904 RepID=UPI003D2DDBC1